MKRVPTRKTNPAAPGISIARLCESELGGKVDFRCRQTYVAFVVFHVCSAVASTVRKPSPGPAGGNRPASGAPVAAAAGRSGWGRPASAAGPSTDGSGLPTPAEAFKGRK